MQNKFLTLAEAAEQIGCHHATVSRQVGTYGLGTRIGNKVIVLTEAEVKRLAKIIKPRPRKRDRHGR
jgi:hypothetical protein